MSQQKQQLFLPDLLAKLTYYKSKNNSLTKEQQSQSQQQQKSGNLMLFGSGKVSKTQSVYKKYQSYDPITQQKSLLNTASKTQPALNNKKQSYHYLPLTQSHNYPNHKKHNTSTKQNPNPQLIYHLKMNSMASNLNVKPMERLQKSQAIKQLKEFNFKSYHEWKAAAANNINKIQNKNKNKSPFLRRNPSSSSYKHSIMNSKQKQNLNRTQNSITTNYNNNNRIAQMKKLQPLNQLSQKKSHYDYHLQTQTIISCPRQRLTVKCEPRGHFSQMRKLSFVNVHKRNIAYDLQASNNANILPWEIQSQKYYDNKYQDDIFTCQG